MWGIVGGKGAVNQNERHLTGVGFEVKEAAAKYGRGLERK
jgi:hypothetical protein